MNKSSIFLLFFFSCLIVGMEKNSSKIISENSNRFDERTLNELKELESCTERIATIMIVQFTKSDTVNFQNFMSENRKVFISDSLCTISKKMQSNEAIHSIVSMIICNAELKAQEQIQI